MSRHRHASHIELPSRHRKCFSCRPGSRYSGKCKRISRHSLRRHNRHGRYGGYSFHGSSAYYTSGLGYVNSYF